jgi:3',5'-cyclic AMP phosphodiesterase CpdA
VRLYAISDLHLGHRENREALRGLGSYPEDWLILGGDVGETLDHLEMALDVASSRFARAIWVPGNHELWTNGDGPRGVEKYQALVALCRSYGVLTPEDPYVVWEGEGGPAALAPLFLLYDYSFRPEHVSRERAIAWAAESGVVCADERFLDPRPHESIETWCAARCDETEKRLERETGSFPVVLINHFPLREDLVRLWRIPRFPSGAAPSAPRTGTQISRQGRGLGHLHVRSTDWIDGVRFEEVSLGYPRHWDPESSIDSYLREILRDRQGERRGTVSRTTILTSDRASTRHRRRLRAGGRSSWPRTASGRVVFEARIEEDADAAARGVQVERERGKREASPIPALLDVGLLRSSRRRSDPSALRAGAPSVLSLRRERRSGRRCRGDPPRVLSSTSTPTSRSRLTRQTTSPSV